MDIGQQTVLVTGGASGIGLAIAQRFSRAGSTVIICGRQESKLNAVAQNSPHIRTRVCDLERESERIALRDWVIREFTRLNVLVNNAGIQRRVQLAEDADWKAIQQEIVINFEAQVHLCLLFIPHLSAQQRSTIINITSGLSFVPLANVPIYSATKAALHSFTLSLRHQLKNTSIDVIEIAPPAVNTDLGGPGLHDFGVPLDEFADVMEERLKRGDSQITYQFSERSSQASPQELEEIFARMNQGPQ
ncbi:MAG: SDR family NAD(P)-dependent oxidoreductase [Candidatus Eremiobacteraeota bacterium]|nr:SDR family NAD(P)-dependent oxidoreductase [Candidatus Eremiobacteraeota bacterium]